MTKLHHTGKRLAQNTMYMYIRMFFLMGISLYTSRVILQQLGVSDFGIYNVVGSVVAMFASLRTLFATSTQRFINYAMGEGNQNKITAIFNMAVIINIILSFIFIVLAECLGLWFIENEMEIQSSRIIAAHWVFQISIVSAIITLLTTPYDALIIANEKMNFYAYIAVLEGGLRLIIVFMLTYSPIDKLIYYALLQLVVSMLIGMIHGEYCHIKFIECKYKFLWDKKLFKSMSAFAGWNFLGNTAFSLTQNGLNMILNTFCGVAANAARGIAFQANTALVKALDAVTTVINPYCTKTYASGKIEKTLEVIYISSKLYLVLQICIALPICILGEEIVNLWLGQIPEYTVGFMQLVMLHTVLRSIHYPINNLFKTVGNLKRYQIAEILILSLPLLGAYITLKLGMSPYSLFWSVIVFEVINYIAIIKIAEKDAGLPILIYIKRTILPCLTTIIIGICCFGISTFCKANIIILILFIFISICLVISYMLLFGFSKVERGYLKSILKRS